MQDMGDARPDSPFLRDSADSSEVETTGFVARVRDWVGHKFGMPPHEEPEPSNYMTLVPLSGVNIGEITMKSDAMSWNTTKRTYQLKLKACIPVYNPNFFEASLSGTFKVHFYDTEAGSAHIKNVVVPARSNPFSFVVDVDASNVPSDYTLTILKECASFPRRLIFFQKIDLAVKYMGQNQILTPIDTYFMIDCVNGGGVPKLHC